MRALVFVILLGACGDSGSSADTQTSPDTSMTDTAPDTIETPLVFRDGVATREAVVLRGVSLSLDELEVEVALTGLAEGDQVWSIGARIAFDPTVLSFIAATPASPWQDGVTAASSTREGVVTLGVSHARAFYEEPGPPLGNVAVYRVRFALTRRAPTALTLVPERSKAVIWPADPEARLNLAWVGGDLISE